MTKLKTSAGRSTNKSGAGKFLAVLLIVAVLAAAGVVFGPRLVHHCSNCDKLFVGTGYYPNGISSAISDLKKEEKKILCADCAAKEHSLEITLGKRLSDFKRPLFEKRTNTDKGEE